METAEQHRIRSLATYHKNRKEWLALNGPCKRCGSWEELEVDHIDESLKVSHKVWFWKKERREEELKKCQVLCKKCHKLKTKAYVEAKEHGTGGKYHAGCRCEPCKQWNKCRVARGRLNRGGR